jgi:PAS domain S-box-containing protein
VTVDFDSAKFSRALQSAILWPMATIFLTALLLIFFIFELFQVVKLSNHSYQVLAQTRDCEAQLVSTEDDVRGFLLTGDQNFVKAYDASRVESNGAFTLLKKFVQDNQEQIIRADDLNQAKNTWFDYAATIISHRTQNIPVSPDWVKVGQTLTDAIHDKFTKFTDVEETLQYARLYRIKQMKTALAYAGSALVILLAFTVAHLVRKQMMALASSYRGALDTIAQRHAALARSEADLEEQKEWLRVTLTSIGDGVIVTDAQGRVVLMNHESEHLTGWTQIEALHQPLSAVFRIVNKKTRAPEEDLVAKILQEKKVLEIANDTLLISRIGEEWPIEDSAAPICDAKGKILGVVVVFHQPRVIGNANETASPVI